MSQTDEDIRKVLEGNIEQYGEVVRACEPVVRAVIAATVPDAGRVDDLTQETFLTAYRKLRRYRSGTNFTAWLRVIARNLALNERRRWIRRTEFLDRHRADLEAALEKEIRAAVEALPDNAVAAVRECVAKLDNKTRALIENFYFKGLSVKELASQMKMTEGAIRVALFRARQEVAALLKKEGVMP